MGAEIYIYNYKRHHINQFTLVLPGDIMLYRCSLCEGKMNRWRYPAIARQDKFGRQLVIYKCVECGNEETYPDL